MDWDQGFMVCGVLMLLLGVFLLLVGIANPEIMNERAIKASANLTKGAAFVGILSNFLFIAAYFLKRR